MRKREANNLFRKRFLALSQITPAKGLCNSLSKVLNALCQAASLPPLIIKAAEKYSSICYNNFDLRWMLMDVRMYFI
jgi:hypothetical protein